MKPIPNEIFFAQVESQLKEGKSVLFKVKGHSMHPFLRNEKDSVLLAPANKVVTKNDVVLFLYNGRHILHRVVAVEGEKYIMQGDGVYASREHCSREEIVGVVTHICRQGGKMVPVTSLWWRLASAMWFHLRFARRWLLAIIRIANSCKLFKY